MKALVNWAGISYLIGTKPLHDYECLPCEYIDTKLEDAAAPDGAGLSAGIMLTVWT